MDTCGCRRGLCRPKDKLQQLFIALSHFYIARWSKKKRLEPRMKLSRKQKGVQESHATAETRQGDESPGGRNGSENILDFHRTTE